LKCTGSKSAVVPLDDGRQVALYAVESPENWFEDFGSGRLQKGKTVIKLDETFLKTVNTELKYHVFLTPRGDCQGLYVARSSSGEFEVQELRRGNSNVEFDYRVVCRRKGYDNIRLADMTDRMKLQAKRRPSEPLTVPTPVKPSLPEIGDMPQK
jgi:hypothetical protein